MVPAYKESQYIAATLTGIASAFRSSGLSFEILVVLDDVPNDETGAKVLEAKRRFPEIRIIERQERRGVGDAISTGIKEAKGDIVIIVMGDQSEHPRDIVRLAEKAQSYDIVFTNRFRGGRPQEYPYLKYAANRICNLSARLIFHIPYSDITNAFKAYKRKLVADIDLTSKGFEIFLELPLKAIRRTKQTAEIDVQHTVKKHKAAKLSISRDGYRYLSLLISLMINSYWKHSNYRKGIYDDLNMSQY